MRVTAKTFTLWGYSLPSAQLVRSCRVVARSPARADFVRDGVLGSDFAGMDEKEEDR